MMSKLEAHWQRHEEGNNWYDKPDVTGTMKEPWYTRAAIILLDQMLKEDFIGFEFGAGRSTKWIARRIKHLTSLEHSQRWFDLVREDLDIYNIDNVDLVLAPVEEFPGYLDHYPDEHFDVIFVDGEKRVDTFKASLPKVKVNGIVVLDDSSAGQIVEWIRQELSIWKRIQTWNGQKETMILIKQPTRRDQNVCSRIC